MPLHCRTFEFKAAAAYFGLYIAKPTSFPLHTTLLPLIHTTPKHVSMSGEGLAAKLEVAEDKLQGTKTKSGTSSEDEASGTIHVSTMKDGQTPTLGVTLPPKQESKPSSQSPTKLRDISPAPTKHKAEREDTVGADISVKMEPGQPLKLTRTPPQKVVARPPPRFDNLPDMTSDAKATFSVITQCIYAAKYLGTTEHAMECDCAEEWGKTSRIISLSSLTVF